MEIIKPSLQDIPELINLWSDQFQYHHDLDQEYYVLVDESLEKEFEKYLNKAIEQNNPNILVLKTRIM